MQYENQLCHSHSCTEQLISLLSKMLMRESVEISAVRYTNMNSIVSKSKFRYGEKERCNIKGLKT